MLLAAVQVYKLVVGISEIVEELSWVVFHHILASSFYTELLAAIIAIEIVGGSFG